MEIDKIEKNKNKIIGKKVEYFKQIESTHTYAKTIANIKTNNGKIIIAENQTKGQGTKGTNWHTGKEKNIAITIILNNNLHLENMQGITIKIAEIMKNVIKKLYNINLKIKKPNDLMLNNKKICGILTEISTIGEKINYMLISLGFNVNEEKFPEEIENIATSLKKEYNKEFKREDIIITFIEDLEMSICPFVDRYHVHSGTGTKWTKCKKK